MARVVSLHVGAPKTGTTYLQDRLTLNRATLERHGVSYPTGLRGDMFGAAVDLIDMPWGGQRDQFHGEWDALASRVRRASGDVVVSHEILAGATPQQVRRALDSFGGAEVHLVYSARDIARQVPAEWQEGIKHRQRKPFKRYLAKVRRTHNHPTDLWFWRAQGLPGVLTRWAADLPPERVHLVTVPQAGAPEDTLWLRYCRALHLDPAWAPAAEGRANVSIGAAESMLVRQLNVRLRQAGIDSDSYRRLVRGVVVHDTLALRPAMEKVTLPPRAHPWAADVAEEWISWVQASGIDVVGDLDDLRPVPPEPGVRWRDPDRPRRRQLNEAALDALTAVIMEAASRPDPEAQLTARVARVARRLRGQ